MRLHRLPTDSHPRTARATVHHPGTVPSSQPRCHASTPASHRLTSAHSSRDRAPSWYRPLESAPMPCVYTGFPPTHIRAQLARPCTILVPSPRVSPDAMRLHRLPTDSHPRTARATVHHPGTV